MNCITYRKKYNNCIAFLLIVFWGLSSGCAEIRHHKAITPEESDGWHNATYYFVHKKVVRYQSGDLTVQAKEVTLEEDQYFVGPVLPIIPWFFHFDHVKCYPKVDIVISIGPKHLTPLIDLSGIAIQLQSEKPVILPTKFEIFYGSRSGLTEYDYTLDLDRSQIAAFSLLFPGLQNKCNLAPLRYRLNEETKFQIAPPQPSN